MRDEPARPNGSGSAADETGGPTHSARDVRGGEIILRTRRRRLIFLAGLFGIILIAVALRLAAAG